MSKNISLLKNALFIENIEPLSFNVYKTLSSSRDSIMARNVLWLNDYYKDKKIIVIAHNGHVTNDPNRHYETFNGQLNPIGYYLNMLMGYQYKSISLTIAGGKATFFNSTGSPTVYDLKVPPKNFIEHYFSLLKTKVFFLNLSKVPKRNNSIYILMNNLKARTNG